MVGGPPGPQNADFTHFSGQAGMSSRWGQMCGPAYAGQYLLERFMYFQPPTPAKKAPTPKIVANMTSLRLRPPGSFLRTAIVSPCGTSAGFSASGAVVAVGNCGLGGSTASSGGTTRPSGGTVLSLVPRSFSLLSFGLLGGSVAGGPAAAVRVGGGAACVGGGPTHGRPVPAAVWPPPLWLLPPWLVPPWLPAPPEAGGGGELVGGGLGGWVGPGVGAGPGPGSGGGWLSGGGAGGAVVAVVSFPALTSILPHMPWCVL